MWDGIVTDRWLDVNSLGLSVAVAKEWMLASATRRKPLPGGSEPASMRATVAEASIHSLASDFVAHLSFASGFIEV